MPAIVERARVLLRGSTELTLGFNAFLPAGCKIEPADIEVRNCGVPRGRSL